MTATLNSILATSARVYLPAWGVWYAEVDLDGEHTLTGAATVEIADLTLRGTILSGGPENGRSHFRVVGGKGGWGQTIAAKGYANDAGVKASTGAAVCLVGWLVAGCTPRAQTAAEVAAYGAELEACAVQASTCPGYVACRQRAAARYGRAYSGRCVP